MNNSKTNIDPHHPDSELARRQAALTGKFVPAQTKGYIHIYAGNGKGKSTAATGLAIRAAARSWKVLFVQFLKSGNSAELRILKAQPTVQVISGQSVSKFTFMMSEQERKLAHEEMTERLRASMERASAVDLLVWDEVLGAISSGLIAEELVLQLMQEKPEHLELVLTGRDPSPQLVEQADYYSEICMRKHPYETEGLAARPGIEF